MEKLKDYYNSHKRLIILGLIVLFIFIGIIYLFLVNSEEATLSSEEITTNKEEKQSDKEINQVEKRQEEVKSEKTIKIDIKGCVMNPGVYSLSEGSRVIDAVEVSGGLTEDAYTKYINLSKILKDENAIIINCEEEENLVLSGENTQFSCEANNAACIKKEDLITSSLEEESESEVTDTEISENSKVNINEADIEELTKLSGIGESKAKKIIDYREKNGAFKSIEEIKNVSGIGDSIYAKIKENITV